MHKTRYFAHCVTVWAVLVLPVAWTQAGDDQAPSSQQEKELIEVLRTAAPAEKAVACKHLAVHGTKQAVPELAPLLADEHLASWARIALEAIPGPEADEALRAAAGTLKGRLLVGTINSVGVRRDAAAVEQLAARLQDQDAEVASAAAVALGRIANAPATTALRGALAGAPPKVRSSVAEGCILCAERLLAEGKTDEAVEIYDEVRRADIPKQRIREATRGAILARKSDGISLLVEQLRSRDNGLFQVALSTARELRGREVAEALAAEIIGAPDERAALLLHVLADRHNTAVLPAVLQAVKSGPKPVRIAAIGVLPRLGDASCLSTLLDIAIEGDAELAQAAKSALAGLSGEKVDAEITSRLASASGKMQPLLIELVGQRRIDATDALVKAIDSSDSVVRGAALTALGTTVGPKQLSVLIAQAVSPKHPDDAQVAMQALRAASIRMPDREACAEAIASAMPRSALAARPALLETLGAVGGAKSLETIGAAAKSSDPQLQDTASRLLGSWMDVDAAPVLLDLAKSAPGDKYKARALRGYVRLARQFNMPQEQRVEMCDSALKASSNPAEQKLVLEVLERYPNMDMLKLAVQAARNPALKQDATRATLVIAHKLGDKEGDTRGLLASIGLNPVKVEIVKAEYGAGAAQKDVTDVLKRQVGDLPLIGLPSPSFSASFGGDPAPGTPKRLTVQYRINGKPGEASFAENTAIVLPMPK